jgi:hypothetical protein
LPPVSGFAGFLVGSYSGTQVGIPSEFPFPQFFTNEENAWPVTEGKMDALTYHELASVHTEGRDEGRDGERERKGRDPFPEIFTNFSVEVTGEQTSYQEDLVL